MNRRQEKLLTIGVTIVATAAVTAFSGNFISGEKKITRRVARRYGIADPQFERSMSQLLGPPILDGNLVTPLRDGAASKNNPPPPHSQRWPGTVNTSSAARLWVQPSIFRAVSASPINKRLKTSAR